MALLHASAEALTPAETRQALGGGPSYSTVVTTLTRLYTKGLLTRLARGRAFAYQPVSDESGLVALQMTQVLRGRRDRAAVLQRFVSNLSADDEQLLRSLLAGGTLKDD
jgi:predicted transcriptional regulator